jgi:divalent metal cation (Fe/Co/Zn/Cd) transporter
VWDGWRNARAAVRDLIDQRARTQDDAQPHPLIDRIAQRVDELPWVRESAVRMRDMGQVFHVEVFAVPLREKVRVRELEEARAAVTALDWKVQDVVVIPTHTLPAEAERAGRAR